ncbi:T6SS immunity protein Tli4 family protein [Massilia pinisoli]
MTRLKKRGWRGFVALLAAFVCAGTWAAGHMRSLRDRTEVATITEKMRTICVGRYLVDAPEDANVNLSSEMIAGFTIDTVEKTEPAFHARMAAREAEISARGAEGNGDGEGGLVAARDLSVPGAVGRSFIYGRSRGYLMAGDRRIAMESVSVVAHAHIDGATFTLAAKGTEEASAREAKSLLARLGVRGEDDIPLTPGFCVRRGVFVEPLPDHTNEHIVFHLGLPGHPDVGLALSSIAGGKADEGLLARVAATDADSSADELLRVTKLRTGKRSVNGIDGEEVLERVRELNFTTGYGFMWEAAGVPDDLLHPSLLLRMETGTNPRPGGKPVESSLHQNAVMALWDRMSSSIRLRKPDARPVVSTSSERWPAINGQRASPHRPSRDAPIGHS